MRPVGAYKLLLVEGMAVTIWRQRRLIRTETAGIELRRADRNRDVTKAVEFAVSGWVTSETYEPLTDDDARHANWCRSALAEMKGLEASDDPVTVEGLRAYPLLYEQAQTDAESAPLEQHYRDASALAAYVAELQT